MYPKRARAFCVCRVARGPLFWNDVCGSHAPLRHTLKIVLNGSPEEVADALAVDELVLNLALAPELVAVEVNGELITRAERDGVQLSEGDTVELVTLVGGG